MTALAIAFGILTVILLCIIILQLCEIKSISRQLREIKQLDTNSLVHSVSSEKYSAELINEINSLLCQMRREEMQYRRKRHDLDQMMTNISHDLRTPLTSAIGYIRMILSASDMPEEEKCRELDIVDKRLIRLEELIDSFFEFSHIISSGEKPLMEQTNIVALIESSIASFYDDYSSRGRAVILYCRPAKLLMSTNANMLRRVFDNLTVNALKHGIGDLTVSVNETADSVSMIFENTSIEQNIDISHIFDEFYTTDISRTKGNTGLGLAIAKQFTEMLGGSIYAAASGSSFKVTLTFSL